MKEVSLPPSEIYRLLKIANDTFGTFDFTYVPNRIKEGEDVADGSDADFWETCAFCACFFPKKAWRNASDPGCAIDNANLESRKRGFEQVCFILGCKPKDEVVAIRPAL